MTSSKRLRRALVASLIAATALITTPAFADGDVRGYPAHWRLQDYEGGAVHLWFTGSSCGSGMLVMSSNAPAESRARLWSLLLTAIGLNRQVDLIYDGNCNITDFYGVES